MRKQQRPETPGILLEHGERWTENWVRRREENSSARFNWPSHDGRSLNEWLLPHLNEMTQRHCAFCDGFPMNTQSRETIEHFRPKSRTEFQHLAFEWSNLYLCCDVCQSNKRDDWDDDLLAPDEAIYRFERYFECNFLTGEILPNALASERDRRRAEVTIRLYGLNDGNRPSSRRLEIDHPASSRPLDSRPYRDFIEAGTLPESASQA